jgi:Bromodomain
MQKVSLLIKIRIDKYRIFAVPVSLESVPDYDQYVKFPMDFSTMQSKLDNSEYLSLDEFSVIFL